ncbi:MAG: M48 family metallopeptidase [Chloroflexi bacterium]|nr:M48 family metallopeptidase [Chloroflexota bacterium]
MTVAARPSATLDADRQEQARSYAALRRGLALIEVVLSTGYLVGLLATGWSSDLARSAQRLPGGPVVTVAVYLVVVGAAYQLLLLPLGFYAGYKLPHRYRLSVQTPWAWLTDWAKGQVVSGILLLLVVEVVYGLLRELPNWWWLAAAGFLLVFGVVLANLAPVLFLPLFYRLSPLEDSPLTRRLSTMAAEAGFPTRGVYRIHLGAKTTEGNAALMGLGGTRRIVLGDTLLEHYDDDEIAVIFAHEVGHHIHRDLPKLLAVQGALTLASLYAAHLALRAGVAGLGLGSIGDIAAFPVLALTVGLAGLVALPLANGFSRHLEWAADRFALETTRLADAFIRAMTRLANQNLLEYQPAGWVEFLLYDHPPIGKRIAAARLFAASRRAGTPRGMR